MSRIYRIGVVGWGRVSNAAHLEAISSLPEMSLECVCDINPIALRDFTSGSRIRCYSDLAKMLSSEEIDILAVNTPVDLHSEAALAAILSGIHVICEKPLGMDLDAIDKLIAEGDRRNVKVFTMLQNRLNPPIMLLKAAVDKGRFGRVLTCDVTIRWNNDFDYYYGKQAWHRHPDRGGGAFSNQGVHYLDLMEWLAGASPETAYARMGTGRHPLAVETHGAGIVTFRNGVIGNIKISTVCYPDDREGSVTVQGERGTVKIGGTALNRVLEWDFDNSDPMDADVEASSYDPPTVYGFGHKEFYKRVIRSLESEDEGIFLADAREGRRSTALLCALYKSAQIGLPVTMPVASFGRKHFVDALTGSAL